jgi:hypothetical protein
VAGISRVANATPMNKRFMNLSSAAKSTR